MLKPKATDDAFAADMPGEEVGMDDILRSIQGILDDAPEPQVTFPPPEARANDAEPQAPKGPPLSFLQRRRAPETIEPVLTTPVAPSLAERLERHRAKAEAERHALRALAERATAKLAERADAPPVPTARIAEPEPDPAPAPQEPCDTFEFDIFAEGEDLIEPPQAKSRSRRMKLPQIEAETVDYSGGPVRAEIVEPVTPGGSLDETFEDIARSMLADRSHDLDGILADMMRPMVREWLDDNLSGIVERVVREEIERVSRGGR